MEEIPTAGEVLNRDYTSTKDNAIKCMIEFAKMHVEAALKKASKNAKASLGKDWISRKEQEIHPGQLVDTIIIKVDKDSILNSYPLTNIK